MIGLIEHQLPFRLFRLFGKCMAGSYRWERRVLSGIIDIWCLNQLIREIQVKDDFIDRDDNDFIEFEALTD